MSKGKLCLDNFTESLAGMELFKKDLVGNSAQHQKMLKLLKKVIEGELTDRQKIWVSLYYGSKMKMSEISKVLDIDVSCVSRHIKKARERIEHTMKYYFQL